MNKELINKFAKASIICAVISIIVSVLVVVFQKTVLSVTALNITDAFVVPPMLFIDAALKIAVFICMAIVIRAKSTGTVFVSSLILIIYRVLYGLVTNTFLIPATNATVAAHGLDYYAACINIENAMSLISFPFALACSVASAAIFGMAAMLENAEKNRFEKRFIINCANVNLILRIVSAAIFTLIIIFQKYVYEIYMRDTQESEGFVFPAVSFIFNILIIVAFIVLNNKLKQAEDVKEIKGIALAQLIVSLVIDVLRNGVSVVEIMMYNTGGANAHLAVAKLSAIRSLNYMIESFIGGTAEILVCIGFGMALIYSMVFETN